MFNWQGPNGFVSSQQNINNLDGGTYILSVTEDNNCQNSFSWIIEYWCLITIGIISKSLLLIEFTALITLTILYSSLNAGIIAAIFWIIQQNFECNLFKKQHTRY